MSRSELVLQIFANRTRKHEGLVLKVYDDANGQLLRPGSVLKGHPTIGYGRALDTNGISKAEADALFAHDVDRVMAEVLEALPWASLLDDLRLSVLLEMAFQMGTKGLLGFRATLEGIRTQDWERAADGMLRSKWATQTPARAKDLAAIIRTGVV